MTSPLVNSAYLASVTIFTCVRVFLLHHCKLRWSIFYYLGGIFRDLDIRAMIFKVIADKCSVNLFLSIL